MKEDRFFTDHFLSGSAIIILWFFSILAVSYLSIIPKVETPIDFDNSDKVYHALAYLWLSFLPYVGFMNKKRALLSALLMIVLGMGLEFCQIFIPEREASIPDIIANSIGVIIGIVSGNALRRFYHGALRAPWVLKSKG
ncbi:MAG: VanZ family protein [Deltaproteobacteria bacterium]|nr:VanZ family protein [Deltaproteobacteria bacterium]